MFAIASVNTRKIRAFTSNRLPFMLLFLPILFATLALGPILTGDASYAGGDDTLMPFGSISIGEGSYADDAAVEAEFENTPADAEELDFKKLQSDITRLNMEYADLQEKIEDLVDQQNVLEAKRINMARYIKEELENFQKKSTQFKIMGSKKIQAGEKLIKEGNQYYHRAEQIFQKSGQAEQLLSIMDRNH